MTYHSLAIYYDNQLAENEQKRVPRDNRFANLQNSIEREKWRTTMILPMRHSRRRAARPPSNFSLTHPPLPTYGGGPPLGPGCLNALVLARKTYAAGVFRLPSCALERSTHGRNDVLVTIADPETGLRHTCGAETPLDILD